MRTELIDLAIIPARAGSKGVPGKNSRVLGQHPLIGWTIRSAILSQRFERIVVTTDCADIARIAFEYGAEVPFMRPAELANDAAGSLEVINHALFELGNIDTFALLQPTSPFRNAEHIQNAAGAFNSDALVSVSDSKPLSWNFEISSKGYLNSCTDKQVATQRQVTNTVVPNGAIYIASRAYFDKSQGFWGDRTQAFVMDQISSWDIDTLSDWLIAEQLVQSGLRTIDS